ncbi:MAG: hypothetical protein ACD_79C00061G0001 [uncultured bacterium]|nr:MAG: hypothetical protein ACD_79C00061G0001 [uncultured bacterium]
MKKNLSVFHKKGFSLVEMMVVFALFSVISISMFSGMSHLRKNITNIKNQVTARKSLTPFCHTVYSFANKSKAVFFFDTSTSAEFDYIAKFATTPGTDPIFETLFFVKNDDESEIGSMVYDPNLHTISWIRMAGAAPTVILNDVYRFDYVNDANPGSNPVFRFPHNSSLFKTPPSRPRLIILEFRKKIADAINAGSNPLTIPIKLITEVNTIS